MSESERKKRKNILKIVQNISDMRWLHKHTATCGRELVNVY